MITSKMKMLNLPSLVVLTLLFCGAEGAAAQEASGDQSPTPASKERMLMDLLDLAHQIGHRQGAGQIDAEQADDAMRRNRRMAGEILTVAQSRSASDAAILAQCHQDLRRMRAFCAEATRAGSEDREACEARTEIVHRQLEAPMEFLKPHNGTKEAVMKPIDLSELAPDPLIKAIAESAGRTVAVSGYVRSTNEDTISICKNPTSRSYVEYPRSSVAAAFRDDDESTKVTLLVASEAEVRIVRHARASDCTGARACGCRDIGVQEARPLGSIHPALAELAAEMRSIKAFLKEGSVELKCALEQHGRIIQGEDSEKVDFEYRKCLLGFPS